MPPRLPKNALPATEIVMHAGDDNLCRDLELVFLLFEVFNVFHDVLDGDSKGLRN